VAGTAGGRFRLLCRVVALSLVASAHGRLLRALEDVVLREIKAVDAKIDSVHLKVDQIDKKLDIDRRMTIMEAKMKELERKA
jgi:hypothetical protein